MSATVLGLLALALVAAFNVTVFLWCWFADPFHTHEVIEEIPAALDSWTKAARGDR